MGGGPRPGSGGQGAPQGSAEERAARLAALRREYLRHALSEESIDPDPLRQFDDWLADAVRLELEDATAFVLSTASAEGRPSGRVLLLKGRDPGGFVFFTDYRSRKAAELEDNPFAAMTFYWMPLERQVRVTGAVERVPVADSEGYFASRPRPSQLGAWASTQSAVITNRAELERRVEDAAKRFAGAPVPLPDHWGGFRLRPEEMEFWQGRESRLHDRIHFRRVPGGAWVWSRLSP